MAGRVERHEQGETRTPRDRVGQLECRECYVICERVVSPWRCLKARHNCVYAFEEGDTTYFGCLHKVFLPELDIAPFSEARNSTRTRTDPYGALRVFRSPLPQCPVGIEQAYSERSGLEGCMNPGFVWRSRIRGASRQRSPDSGFGGMT